MTSQRFIIAHSSSADRYFTSRSSYNRPEWVGLTEARVYFSADLAQQACSKLHKAGTYSATVRPLIEQTTEQPSSDMTAVHSGNACTHCNHEPCTCDAGDEVEDDNSELNPEDMTIPVDGDEGIDTDTTSGIEGHPLDDHGDTNDQSDMEDHDVGTGNEEFNRGDAVNYRGQQFMVSSVDRDVVTITPVNNPQARPIEVDPSQLVRESVDEISYSDTEPSQTTQMTLVDKVAVPGDVRRELKQAIADQQKLAKNTTNSDEAGFRETAADALSQLLTLISSGLAEDIKRAQILLTSLMGPITQLIPSSVVKFIYTGGARPKLADRFNIFKKSS